MAGIILRSTDFKAVTEPILNGVFDGLFDQRVREYSLAIDEEDGIKRAYHEEAYLYGFPAAPQLGDGMPVTYAQGGQLFTMRAPYNIYGLAFAITKVLQEDGDHIRVGKTFSEHLAQAMDETLETVPVNMLNRGFNAAFLGGDGVPLFSNAHLSADGSPAGAPQRSNILPTAAALSQTSLEQMLIQIRSTADPQGKKIRVTPKKLVVSPNNELQAEVLLKSVLRTGTNNNDLNPVNSLGMLKETVTLTRLTSPTAWFIKTDMRKGPRVFWRRKCEKRMEGDFETNSMRYAADMRFGVNWLEWRAFWGTPGQ